MGKGGATGIIYLGFCKAFDTVPPATRLLLGWSSGFGECEALLPSRETWGFCWAFCWGLSRG